METETSILKRIEKIMKEYHLNESEFCKSVGLQRNALSMAKSRKQKDVKSLTIVNILNAFPEIRIEWLVMGEGSMKKQQEYHQKTNDESQLAADGIVHYAGDVSMISELETRIAELKQDKDLQYKHIAMLEQRISELEKGSEKKTKSKKAV